MKREQKLPPGTASRALSIAQKGFDTFAEIQKSAFDIYEQHTKTAMESARQVFPLTPSSFFEMAEQGLGEFLKMQKSTLDLVLKQGTVYMDTMRANSLFEDGGEMSRLMRDSAEYFVSMQKNAADFATQHAQRFADTTKWESGAIGTPASNAADAIQRGTEAVVEAQRRFWGLMLMPFENAGIETQT